MPYEDESWRWNQQAYDDLNGPVVWKDPDKAAEMFEQEHAAKPDPVLEELERHLDETWASIAHLYEGEV